jgi:purine-binding chemotaxis protein CheW
MVLNTDIDELSREQKKAILDERAAFLAQASTATKQREHQLDILELVISGKHFAIEARFVREASKAGGALTPLPNTPDFVLGLMNFRGQILPLLDLRKLLEVGPKESNSEMMVVVIQVEQGQAGIIVDEIVGINSIAEAGLQSPKQLVSAAMAPLLKGVREDMLAVLDVNVLFNDPRLVIETYP